MIPIKVLVTPLKNEPDDVDRLLFDGTYMMLDTLSADGEPCALLVPLDGGDERGMVVCSFRAHSVVPTKGMVNGEELPVGTMTLAEFIDQKEKDFIAEAVNACGSKEAAAATLDISIATLYRKLGRTPPMQKSS